MKNLSNTNSLRNITGRGSLFQTIKEQRNINVHPENIDITEIIKLAQKLIGTGRNLEAWFKQNSKPGPAIYGPKIIKNSKIDHIVI